MTSNEKPEQHALFQSSLPPSVHEEMFRLASMLGENTPHEEVPTAILADPKVITAAGALLGHTAKPDICKHIHENNQAKDGDWHQDDYDGNPWPEGDWAILFYFPQDTPLEMGGTSISVNGQEIIAEGPAGTCLLARGDVTHRARANTTGRNRIMMKYLFRQIKRAR